MRGSPAMGSPDLLPPYGEFAPRLLADIFDALRVLSEPSRNADVRLDRIFQRMLKQRYFRSDFRVNKHLIGGLRSVSDDQDRPRARLTRVTRQAFQTAEEALGSGRGVYLPSPLHILYEVLTVPEEPQSRAYALAVCRWLLFSVLQVKPHTEGAVSTSGWTTFTQQDVLDAISNFRTYYEHRDNIEPTLKRTQLFVAHFLAMKGVFRLRFGGDSESAKRKKRLQFCKTKALIGFHQSYEFRLASTHTNIPDAAELINDIWGIPIPIRGAETVFFGGLNPLSDGALVISVSGQPGTGKTSWALALAASLAPMGTSTYYITIEERANDLYSRLVSLIPPYLKKLSIYQKDSRDWCRVEEYASERTIQSLSSLYLEEIQKRVSVLRQRAPRGILPAPCPLMIVIDGLSELGISSDSPDQTPDSALKDFLLECRKLRLLVVLMSGEGCKTLERLDYLVDVVCILRYENTSSVDNQPFRLLQLVKSRNQMSRPGSHLFHLSGEKGLRISPHVGSQLDRRRGLRQRLPAIDEVIPVLNKYEQFLDLYHGSKILLHGHGSSGKAGLALRILITPPTRQANAKPPNLIARRKVLVVSFLYPQEYYDNLLQRIDRTVKSDQEYLVFVAGFLRPQDLLGKIIRRIEAASLNGTPFTGVLLDGLHNVFLQFPALREDDTIWSAIYGYLSLHKITTVSTFTTFEIIRPGEDARDFEEFHIKGHVPFLNALVNAADFYLLLESHADLNELSARVAIGQRVPGQSIWWDREKLCLVETTKALRIMKQQEESRPGVR